MAALVVVTGLVLWLHNTRVKAPSNMNTSSNKTAQSNFNKQQFSIDEASSPWAVVNKGRVLPAGYEPGDLVAPGIPLRLSSTTSEMHLRREAASALELMAAGAKASGANLMLASGYRSYSVQSAVYNSEVKNYGTAQANRESAQPGHSEHQTGLAADLEPADRSCEVTDCFADTVEGKWLAANAYKYDFIIRYQKNNETLTGYRYEPWHIRYIGKDLAAQINASGQTLEQFFGLPSYADYPASSFALK
jgi:D-alanyl-D-alanine carboxypeptidase